MHWNYRLGTGRDGALHRCGVNIVKLRIAIHQHRLRACHMNRHDRRDERVSASDDFVARPDAAGQQRQLQRLRAVGDRQAMRRFTESRKLLLEQLHVLSQDKVAAPANPRHGNIDLRFDLLVLTDQIHELNFPIVHICLSPVCPLNPTNLSYCPPPVKIFDLIKAPSTHLTQAAHVTEATHAAPFPAYFACRTTRACLRASSAFVKYSAGRFMDRIHSA